MFIIFLVGAIVMVACLAVQVTAVALVVRYYADADRKPLGTRPIIELYTQLTTVMVGLLFAGVLQMAAWALLYQLHGRFPDFETALYFSGVTFTSLGYGDITLPPRIRLLSAMEASDGLMMFGITSAIFVGAMQHSLKQVRAHLERGDAASPR